MPGGKTILVAVGALLKATKGVSDRYDAVEEALKMIKRFLESVQIHLRPATPPDPAVMDVLIDTFVQVFIVITIITEYISIEGEDKSKFGKAIKVITLRGKDYVRILFGRTDVQDALAKLKKLATTELEMVVAHNNAMLRERERLAACATVGC
ncbi:hypothetical protein PENSPDRAFT_664743 [Peniophora sp. CONT]|nr:hypothetical protein PENSPDRAFT_664743 [Peniophora sp. CONT]